MTEKSSVCTAVKIASILVLIANHAVTVNATPLGDSALSTSRFYWLLLLAVLLVLSAIYYFMTTKSPVQVVGLAYDKTNHKLELTVKNSGDEPYYIKSALRLLQPAEEVVKSATQDGSIPMAAAKASVGNRRLFQLLCEDDSPIALEPNETRTIAYDLILPPQYLKLDESKNVEVHISYSEENPQPEVVSAAQEADASDGFCIKMESGEVVAEAFLLDDLLEAVRKSPDEAIGFHLKEGNDFANWVRNVIGDAQLAQDLEAVAYSTPQEARDRIAGLLDAKVESLKHPFLRKVDLDKRFILKADHDKILSEVLMLEELAETIVVSPAEAIAFHTREGNDFAAWVKGAVGDAELAQNLSAIDYSKPAEAKNRVVSTILERVDSLK